MHKHARVTVDCAFPRHAAAPLQAAAAAVLQTSSKASVVIRTSTATQMMRTETAGKGRDRVVGADAETRLLAKYKSTQVQCSNA